MKSLPRRTKIIATLGPATDLPEKMRALIEAGANLVRVNCSHETGAVQTARILLAKKTAKQLKKTVGILLDLQGPKIRIACFKQQEVFLKEGATFVLDADLPFDEGTAQTVGLDYKNLPRAVKAGDHLLLDDGRIDLLVKSVAGSQVTCEVILGGPLSNNKGLNRQGGGLSAPVLTDKDKDDLRYYAKMPIDYVAISFPKSAEDIHQVRALMQEVGLEAQLVAKIERVEAVEAISEIIEASDAIMVARGDLGVEIRYAELPGVQKAIINKTIEADKPVIVATQMMESMVRNPIPTRAEVSDVANAILDGTDAVMLSAETATGDFPIKVVENVHKVCLSAERHPVATISEHRIETLFSRHDEAIAMAAMYVANHVPIKAIVTLTETGSTPLWMSRICSSIPIYALSRHASSCARMTLYRGVYPVEFDVTAYKPWEVDKHALACLIHMGVLQTEDKVIVTKGHVLGVGGRTNTLEILTAKLFK